MQDTTTISTLDSLFCTAIGITPSWIYSIEFNTVNILRISSNNKSLYNVVIEPF